MRKRIVATTAPPVERRYSVELAEADVANLRVIFEAALASVRIPALQIVPAVFAVMTKLERARLLPVLATNEPENLEAPAEKA
jgi:hypothetical protein